MVDGLLTRNEVAERLGLSAQTVGRMIKTGVFPAKRIGIRKLFVPAASVEQYIANSQVNLNDKGL